jgi:hypothetical protein
MEPLDYEDRKRSKTDEISPRSWIIFAILVALAIVALIILTVHHTLQNRDTSIGMPLSKGAEQ